MVICFEGINGAGKSTQIGLLRAYLETHNRPYRVLHDPGVEPGHKCQVLRELFVYGDNWSDPRTPLLIGSAARNELTNVIRGVLRDTPRTVVILDRYELSTYAYQTLMLEDGGFSHDESLSMIRALHNILHCVTPDLLVFLDTDPETAYPRRTSSRRKEDRPQDDQFEVRGLAFARRLAARYRESLDLGDDRLYEELVVVESKSDNSPAKVFSTFIPAVASLLGLPVP